MALWTLLITLIADAAQYGDGYDTLSVYRPTSLRVCVNVDYYTWDVSS